MMLAKMPQRRSSSVVSNRSIALITNKFSVALLTKPAILNNANVALVDAVHYSVIDALTMTLIKDDDDLLGTVNSYIKPPLKRCKTKAADSRHVKLGKEAQLKKTRDEEELAKAKKEKEEKELTDAYILYFKELLSDNSRIFANAIGIGKTRAIVLAVLIRHCDLSDLLALRFCFFSDSPPENIGRLTKEKAIEMRIDTTDAISKALAAANKLTIPEANTPAVHSKATKHRLAPSAARFVIVCGFRKVDKHVFRAYNTISVTAQRTIIRKGGSYIEKRAILLPGYITRNIIANVKHDASEHESSYKYKELISQGAVVAQRFICKVKRFTLNSVKDLFTNLSKDYFLVREARAITKSSLKDLDRPWIIVALIAFAEAIILTEATHVLAEMCVGIVYFNLDSELELKVLDKQDVKTTS
ncbi:hypothetical protein HBH49_201710 [Parastagonospora nodorum]|nr:hypothetical protein HBH49_201710 [Parastagonospora nodorum]